MTAIINFNKTKHAFAYKSTAELRKAYFIFSIVDHPAITWLATRLLKMVLAIHLPVKGIVRRTVFQHFCGGETMEETEDTVKKLFQYGVHTILDYSVEGLHNEESFDSAAKEITKAIEHAHQHYEIPFCVFKPTGIASFDLLVKIHAGEELSAEEEESFQRVQKRIGELCARAYSYDVPILIDAEYSWIQKPIDELVYTMMRKYNREKAIVYNTYQMYLSNKLKEMEEALRTAQQEGYKLGVKMVRGAYLEKERERAAKGSYDSPICSTKADTDALFNNALELCVKNREIISLIACTHNEVSNQHLAFLMELYKVKPNHSNMWFAQLMGMSDNISFNLAKAGYQVAKYVPYGPLEGVIPYLIRRAKENTSVVGQTSRELSMIKKELKRRKRQSR